QLQHVASQMWRFARPSMYGGVEDKVGGGFAATRGYSGNGPGKAAHGSGDGGQNLPEQEPERRGLLLLPLPAPGGLLAAGAADENDEADRGSDDDNLEDTRLILVTDLGFIVKQAKDGSRDVFVQSIRSGLPVDGARVEMVGSNGLPVQSATTDASGRAELPRP